MGCSKGYYGIGDPGWTWMDDRGQNKEGKMTDYTELVEALRHCYEDDDACATCQRWLAHDEWGIKCKGRLISDAAAAIEELQAQLPKRGEWIPYEFNTNGTWHKCSVCGVAYQYKDAPNSGWWINHKYCPNCGAKMEVLP